MLLVKSIRKPLPDPNETVKRTYRKLYKKPRNDKNGIVFLRKNLSELNRKFIKRKKRYIKWKLNFCESCDSRENLDAHHVIPRSEGGTDDKDNIITLCKPCHRQVHIDLPDKFFYSR
jgi:5-methylcytosine-specific restriction endonuclease McrA